jgi:hypothetical protein
MPSLVVYSEDGSAFAAALDPAVVLTVGRHDDNLLPLQSGSVSGRHAQIAAREEGWFVQDLGSSNGTSVNGAPVEEARLEDGDRLAFGDTQAIFYLSDEAAADAATAAVPVLEAALPDPTVEVVPIPAPVPGGRTRPRKLPAERLKQVQKQYPGADNEGCITALVVAGVLVFAICLGLGLRHYQETGNNFFKDAMRSMFDSMPKITIEK